MLERHQGSFRQTSSIACICDNLTRVQNSSSFAPAAMTDVVGSISQQSAFGCYWHSGCVGRSRQPFVAGIVGPTRILWTLALVDSVVRRGIEGDVVETGVFSGGSAIAMARMLSMLARDNSTTAQHSEPHARHVHGHNKMGGAGGTSSNVTLSSRLLWACDSFKGLPATDDPTTEASCNDLNLGTGVARTGCLKGAPGLFASSRGRFETNMHKFANDFVPNLRIVEGFFGSSLRACAWRVHSVCLTLHSHLYVPPTVSTSALTSPPCCLCLCLYLCV